jgi:hypothetical protein
MVGQMTKKSIIQELEELASDESKRSKAARLRDVFDTVEATLARGVTIAAVVKKLSENGLEMTVGTFKNEMYRIRKKRGKPSARLSKSEPNKAKASTVQESHKNEETEQEPEKDYDELAVLSARERRERSIAQFTSEKRTNPVYEMLIKDKTK